MAFFAGKTVFITGASRGIGKAIGLRLAREGANIVIAAKTTEPHPKLEGTIFTAAAEMDAAGGKGLPVMVDIRDPESINAGVAAAVDRFGGIDIVVNNASAISLTGTAETPVKRYDLMHQVDGRGTFLTTQACLPHLKKGRNPHILTISPPLNLNPRWFKNHVAYTTAKYSMSMNSLGWAEEFRDLGIASNCLWPRTAIATAAMAMLGGPDAMAECRKPEIMADAAAFVLASPSGRVTGNFFLDDDVLLSHHPKINLDQYAHTPGHKLLMDFFLDDADLNFAQSQPNQTVTKTTTSFASASSPPSISSYIEKMHKNMVDAGVFRSFKGSVKIEIDSGKPTQASWLITETGNLEPNPTGEASCTVKFSTATFHAMLSKQVSPQVALFKGDLSIKGDMGLALKLAKFL